MSLGVTDVVNERTSPMLTYVSDDIYKVPNNSLFTLLLNCT